MKNRRITGTLFHLASILFYVASIITFASGNDNSMGVVWLCLGSAFLCLGTTLSRKERQASEDKDEKRKTDEVC